MVVIGVCSPNFMPFLAVKSAEVLWVYGGRRRKDRRRAEMREGYAGFFDAKIAEEQSDALSKVEVIREGYAGFFGREERKRAKMREGYKRIFLDAKNAK